MRATERQVRRSAISVRAACTHVERSRKVLFRDYPVSLKGPIDGRWPGSSRRLASTCYACVIRSMTITPRYDKPHPAWRYRLPSPAISGSRSTAATTSFGDTRSMHRSLNFSRPSSKGVMLVKPLSGPPTRVTRHGVEAMVHHLDRESVLPDHRVAEGVYPFNSIEDEKDSDVSRTTG